MVFPSSSSLNGHPGRPGKRATGGSPSGVSPSPVIDKLLLWTDMSNPDDDTDVPSGFSDDAEMERTSPRVSETCTQPTH